MSITSVAFSLRGTRIATHSRLNSSIIFRILIFLPSWVLASTKSYDETWLGRSGLSRTHGPSLSQSRLRFGCLMGTSSPPPATPLGFATRSLELPPPSRREIRSTRFRFTVQPCRPKTLIEKLRFEFACLKRSRLVREAGRPDGEAQIAMDTLEIDEAERLANDPVVAEAVKTASRKAIRR